MKYYKFSKKQVMEVLTEAGVPLHLHDEAYNSVKEGHSLANTFKCLFSNLSAPFVVPLALLFTKWDSEKLPKQFDWYNNDTNLNGDKNIPVSLDKNDPIAIKSCYYREGHHPREYLSRYIWIGLRNRGKMSYMQPVKDLSLEIEEEVWGVRGLTRGDKVKPPVTGWTVTRLGSYWQIIGCHAVEPKGIGKLLKGYFQQPKWGWKTGLSKSLHRKYGSDRVMAVGFNFKFNKRKD